MVGTVAQKRAPLYIHPFNEVPARLGCLFYAPLDDSAPALQGVLPFMPLSWMTAFCMGCFFTDFLWDRDAISPGGEGRSCPYSPRELGSIFRTYDLLLSSKTRITENSTLFPELGRILTSNMDPNAILENIALITAKALNASFSTIKLDLAFHKTKQPEVYVGQ